MTPSIALDTASTLRTYIDNATTRDKPALPGAIVHMVDKNNNKVFTYASSRAAQLSENSIALVHSLTKMVGAIAFMQLVEQGLAALDDSSVIEKVLPELAVKQVLTGYDNIGKPILVGKVGDITPRMLMNHTYGGGHSFFNPLMKKYMQDGWEKRNEVADPHQTILDAPLLWQPGTHTNYGQGFDWLATLIERLTNKNLATLLEENIFGKLGLKRLDFEETYGGDITTRPEILAKPEREKAFPEGKYHTYPLGTGLGASMADIARLFTILLPHNWGVDPVSGTRILSEESVGDITKPQLSEELRNDVRNMDITVEGMLRRLVPYILEMRGNREEICS